MSQIGHALGNHYQMFYHPGIDIGSLTTGQTLDRCIQIVNQALAQHGFQWEHWPWEPRNEAARLVWVSWIYQRLSIEPIRKPVLVRRIQNRLHVLCGDTRIMSLAMLPEPPSVSVIVTCRHDQRHLYQDWIEVLSDHTLIELLRFDPLNTQIFFNASPENSDYAIDWFEIGDPSTGHHGHDEQARWHAFCNWAVQNPDSSIDRAWAQSYIDWKIYGV